MLLLLFLIHINMKHFIKQYTLAIVAVLTILGFSAFKANGVAIQQPRMTIALYYHGDIMDQSQVEDGAFWYSTPNGETCNFVNHRACMQLVEHTDLTVLGKLDTTKITLGSMFTGVGYIPTRIGGSSSTVFTPINRY